MVQLLYLELNLVLRNLLKYSPSLLVVLLLTISLIYLDYKNESNINEKRLVHQNFLQNSPFLITKDLSKSERRSRELPPNSYNEKIWELSMNPATGRPEPEKLFKIQKELRDLRYAIDDEKLAGVNRNSAVPGENEEMKWIQRGPINVGGRTKALMFDPNDNTSETVFSGGVFNLAKILLSCSPVLEKVAINFEILGDYNEFIKQN